MLDWFTGLLDYDGSGLPEHYMYVVDELGEVHRSWRHSESVRGSFEASVQVGRGLATLDMIRGRETCPADVLSVSGNPAKFLQGHNVFGPNAFQEAALLREFVRQLPESVRPPDADRDELPVVHRSRADVTTYVDLDSHSRVHQWLDLAARQTRSRHGRAVQDVGTTVYWGKTSGRWTLKAYCKFCELDKHPPSIDPFWVPILKEFTETLVRVELTLRGHELENLGTLDEELIWKYFGRLEVGVMSDEVKRAPDLLNPALDGLPVGAKTAFGSWLGGEDLRGVLPRRTFYHYRRLLLTATGVDISLPWQGDQEAGLSRLGFDVEYLRAHQIKYIPDGLQPILAEVSLGKEAWSPGFHPSKAPLLPGYMSVS